MPKGLWVRSRKTEAMHPSFNNFSNQKTHLLQSSTANLPVIIKMVSYCRRRVGRLVELGQFAQAVWYIVVRHTVLNSILLCKNMLVEILTICYFLPRWGMVTVGQLVKLQLPKWLLLRDQDSHQDLHCPTAAEQWQSLHCQFRRYCHVRGRG